MSEADEEAESEQISEDLDHEEVAETLTLEQRQTCLLYTSPSPRDRG